MIKTLLSCTLLTISTTAMANAIMPGTCQLQYGGNIIGNVYNGPTQCGQGKIGSIIINGPASMEDTQATGTLKVNGPTSMSRVHANQIIVHGPLTMSQSTTGQTTVYGPLNTSSATLGNTVVHASEIALSDTNVKSLTIYTCTTHTCQPHLTLNGHTTIKDDLQFIGQGGTVYVGKAAKILGHVHNAKVIHKGM